MKSLRPFSAETPAVAISTVTPMRNELPCVREFVRRVDVVLRSTGENYEIIVVDDGSTDGTGELLDDLTAEFPQLRPIHLKRSFGQAVATDAGFQETSGRYVVMLDGDLEQPPEEIPRLIEQLQQGFDLVSGRRTNRTISKFWRAIPSRTANWLLRRATGCDVRDMGGIKALRGEIARSLRLRPGQHRFLPATVHVLGGKVTEIPVAAHPRFAGQSHYGISRTVDVLLDVAYFASQTSGHGRPVYLFGRISLGLLTSSGLLALSVVIALLAGSSGAAWPLALLAVGLSLSALMFWAVGATWESALETQSAVLDRSSWRTRSEPNESHAESPRRRAG